MCVVSMVMDHYWDKWTPQVPIPLPRQFPLDWTSPPTITVTHSPPSITPEEISEFRTLLERAREYDKRNSEPNCELQEKKDRLKALAKDLGFNIDFIDEKET